MRIISFPHPFCREGTSLSSASHLLTAEMDRFLQAPEADSHRSRSTSPEWIPDFDVREDEEDLTATFDIPGVRREDINVSVHQGVLSVSGERSRTITGSPRRVLRSERPFGRFQRHVRLPKPIQPEAVRATYREGQLTVVLPKTPEARCKRIEVSLG